MNAQPAAVATLGETNRSMIPWGSVAMLGMIAAIEVGVSRRDLDVSTVWAQDWRFAAHATRVEAPTCAVLCLGDSLMKYGVYPKVVESELGAKRRVYNLAMHSGKAPGTYFVLRAALEQGARPSAIVVDFDAVHLLMEPRSHLRQWPELISTRDSLDLAWSARDASLGGSLLAAKVLRSLRARDEIKEYLYDLYKRKLHFNRYALLIHKRNWAVNQGAQVVGPPPEIPEAVKKKIQPPVLGSWTPNAVNDRYVHLLLSLAQARGIAVFWLIPPCREAFQKRRDEAGGEKDYDAYVREIERRYPNVIVLDARRSHYPDSVFQDLTHLHRAGAISLSASLGAAIRQGLNQPSTGDRWVLLPPFQEIKTSIALEELEESRKAVRNEHAGRKR